jgi:ATP-dependent protease Clp ATPase subunit
MQKRAGATVDNCGYCFFVQAGYVGEDVESILYKLLMVIT